MGLSRERMLGLLGRLDFKLGERGEHGTVQLYGGAVMCLVHGVRESTEDIDAVYEPKLLINGLAREVAGEEGVSSGWINDSVKGFLSIHDSVEACLELPHLTVLRVSDDCLLAMKCRAARSDGIARDLDDIRYLIGRLDLGTIDEALEVLTRYYDEGEYPVRTWLLLQEVFGDGR